MKIRIGKYILAISGFSKDMPLWIEEENIFVFSILFNSHSSQRIVKFRLTIANYNILTFWIFKFFK